MKGGREQRGSYTVLTEEELLIQEKNKSRRLQNRRLKKEIAGKKSYKKKATGPRFRETPGSKLPGFRRTIKNR